MPQDNSDLSEERRYWDREASTFDNEADHGLHDPVVRSAWRDLLLSALPPSPASLLDMGCGTGTLSILLAELGYKVTGLDFSPAMITRAMAKAGDAGLDISFQLGDAADPPINSERFDAVVGRHLLWALPDPTLALQRWANLLLPQGRMLLIEGFWHTGAGLHFPQVVEALPSSIDSVTIKDLASAPELWGSQVNDERYMVVARLC